MKTYKQFVTNARELNEGKVALAKMAFKGLSKVARKIPVMKKKLTSAKTSRDPNSRINKALRRWNC